MTTTILGAALALLPALAVTPADQTLTRSLVDADVASHAHIEVSLTPQRDGAIVVPFTHAGETHTLRLKPHTVRAPTFRVFVDDGAGELHQIEPPAPATFVGTIDGRPHATVTASIIGDEITAVVRLDHDEAWSIQPASDFAPGASGHLLITSSDLIPRPDACEAVTTIDAPQRPAKRAHEAPRSVARGGAVKVAQLAWEIDFPAHNELGSSIANSIAEVERITNDINAVYERDTSITHRITDIVVRTSSASDPYTSTSSVTTPFLNAVSAIWTNPPLDDVERDLVHLLTGKDIVSSAGNSNVIGVAYVDTVCSQSAGIGISENRSSALQEAGLVAHELGHNWSARHCNGDSQCRIMCSGLGGCDGLNPLQFEAGAIASITGARDDAGCLDDAAPVNVCAYDTNNDGAVNIIDFGAFGAAFNATTGDANYNPSIDTNSDGVIDIIDFGAFGSEFNRTDCLP